MTVSKHTIIGHSDAEYGPPLPQWWQTKKGQPLKRQLDTWFNEFGIAPKYDGPTYVQLLFRLAQKRLPGRPKKRLDFRLIQLFQEKMVMNGVGPEDAALAVAGDPRSKSLYGARTKNRAAALLRTYYRERRKLAELDSWIKDTLSKSP
jgi:hypothetical protein